MKTMESGVYPTMITPFVRGEVDEAAVGRLVDFYASAGCRGIFAVCQSSEMAFLSRKERLRLARLTAEAAAGRMTVVASGHCANSPEEQAEELQAMGETGVDAVVLVTNRLDPHGDGDGVWMENGARLLGRLDPAVPLGLYECPRPYKRLLTPALLDWCAGTGRFRFFKDTCCDPALLTARLKQLEGSGLLLFNANAQTLLHSLQTGGSGYSGIMANFCPALPVWLCDHFRDRPDLARTVSDCLSMMAFTEGPVYPVTAKYALNRLGVSMTTESRSCDPKKLTEYERLTVDQLLDVSAGLERLLKEKEEIEQ